MVQTKAKGGTMVMWETSLDPYISVVPTTSSAVAAILLNLPGVSISAHVAIYLPTAGQEAQFLSALADLEELLRIHENLRIFIRGDSNVNPKNQSRSSLLSHFLSTFSLLKVDVPHPTYHHFLGDGMFDSQLDILLHPCSPLCSESVFEIVCKNANLLIQSPNPQP